MSLVLRDGKEPEVAVCCLPVALVSVEGNKAGFPGLSNALPVGGPSSPDAPAQ